MSPRVKFLRTDSKTWERTTNCEVPVIGDHVSLIPIGDHVNEEVLDHTKAAYYEVVMVHRSFISIEFEGPVADVEGTLIQHEIEVLLSPKALSF